MFIVASKLFSCLCSTLRLFINIKAPQQHHEATYHSEAASRADCGPKLVVSSGQTKRQKSKQKPVCSGCANIVLKRGVRKVPKMDCNIYVGIITAIAATQN